MIRGLHLLICFVTVLLISIGFGFNAYQRVGESLRHSKQEYEQLKEQSKAMIVKIRDLLKDKNVKKEECSKEKQESLKAIEASKESNIRAEKELAKVVISHAAIQAELQTCNEAHEETKQNAFFELEQLNKTCNSEHEEIVYASTAERKRLKQEWAAERQQIEQACLAQPAARQNGLQYQAQSLKGDQAEVQISRKRRQANLPDVEDISIVHRKVGGQSEREPNQVAPPIGQNIQSEQFAKQLAPQLPKHHDVQKLVTSLHHQNDSQGYIGKVVKRNGTAAGDTGPPVKPGSRNVKNNSRYPELDSEQFMFEARFGPAGPVKQQKSIGGQVAAKSVVAAPVKSAAKGNEVYDVERD